MGAAGLITAQKPAPKDQSQGDIPSMTVVPETICVLQPLLPPSPTAHT